MSTLIIWANEDVQVIKSKFAREFWLASRKEAVKVIARANLAQVNLCAISSLLLVREILFLDFPYTCFSTFLSWSRKETAGKALRPLKTLLTMKIQATLARRARAAAVTVGVMTTKLPGTKRILRRLILWIRCLPELFAPSRLLLYICAFT
jgi:hypothetical protein